MTKRTQAGAQLALNHQESTALLGSQRVRVTRKCLAMLSLLSVARASERQGGNGWVTVSQIGDLALWRGKRSASSLRSQVRREVKMLHAEGLTVVEARQGQLLRGPFRLSVEALVTTADYALAGVPLRRSTRGPADLLRWLDDSRYTTLSAWDFDKPEHPLDLATSARMPSLGAGLSIRVLACVTRARGAREQGQFDDAVVELRKGLKLAEREPDVLLRTRMTATCHMQIGWTEYRRPQRRPERVDAAIARALDAVEGHGHLVLRGQVLTLSALQHIARQQFDEAVHCLWKAAEYFSVEVDLYNLFSVYHNLSRLLVTLADKATDASTQRDYLKLAIKATTRSQKLCDDYAVGQNSVISLVQLANLCTRVGAHADAVEYADKAFERATTVDNRVEIDLAHWQRLRARLAAGHLTDADDVQRAYVQTLPPALRAAAIARYPTIVAAVSARTGGTSRR